MIIEKLMSKRGQISMEIGILVAAAVAVAAIAAYFYVTSVRNSATEAGARAGNATERLRQLAENATEGIPTNI